MYRDFFGLRERPFDLSPNPRYLVLTNAHQEAISNIEYAVASRKGIMLLIGEAGSGKTTVIRAAIERQSGPVHCVHLNNLALTREEFVEMLAARFGLSEKAAESKAVLLLELEQLLLSRHRVNEKTLLIVDEAQGLSLGLLEEIRLLANIETDEEKLLSVVLAGQPELATRLDDPSVRQLKQRIALWCELQPLTFEETAAYILSRIEFAGGIGANVFTIEAVALIHAAARGIPRIINVIADNALIAGRAIGQRPVNSQTIQHVCHEIRIRQGVGSGAPPASCGAGTPYILAGEPSRTPIQSPDQEATQILLPSPSTPAASDRKRRF